MGRVSRQAWPARTAVPGFRGQKGPPWSLQRESAHGTWPSRLWPQEPRELVPIAISHWLVAPVVVATGASASPGGRRVLAVG